MYEEAVERERLQAGILCGTELHLSMWKIEHILITMGLILSLDKINPSLNDRIEYLPFVKLRDRD
jgi:hypothetical protein